MSGHSKWSTIKHAKAISDARRGKMFTKFSKEIIVAARSGGGEVESNFKLRMAVQHAKDANMPADTIERAIQKGSGKLTEGAQLTEMRYEGYGPGGTATDPDRRAPGPGRGSGPARGSGHHDICR